MADVQRPVLGERDIDQAIAALKKGTILLKYGRRGKPKFCRFRLSTDESALIWHHGKEEKFLELHCVLRIIPGQRTPVFQRYPQPDKEYLSFSLICEDRSLDLICKDKEEAEVWFTSLKAIVGRGSSKKRRNEATRKHSSSCSPNRRKMHQSYASESRDDGDVKRSEIYCQNRLGKAFADIVSITATVSEPHMKMIPVTQFLSFQSAGGASENSNPGVESFVSAANFPSPKSSASSECSSSDEDDTVGNIYIWGEKIGDGIVAGASPITVIRSSITKTNAPSPNALEPTMSLDDAHDIACGETHAVSVSKQGEVFSWGDAAGGKLGRGVEPDIPHPKHIEALCGKNIKMAACGRHHSCAVSHSGDLYTWGDDPLNCGLLGHGGDASHWTPQRIGGPVIGLHVSFVACGPWHTAFFTSSGRLFTFGDGAFGALGHGDRSVCSIPREVEAFTEFRTMWVSCGTWHTAAVVDTTPKGDGEEPDQRGKLYTWGDGEKGQLGDRGCKSRLIPDQVACLADVDFSRVACGEDVTVALTTSGQVYAMGSAIHGQLGVAEDGNFPVCVRDGIADCCVEDIACGSHHIAVLTSKSEVYTWGKGANGQLGHGDNDDRHAPTLVACLKDKQIKSVACGSNSTAVICLSLADDSVCAGCRNPFNFKRPRRNCYNCGLVFCNACSTRKSLKAALAPSTDKPYRVCDDCFIKLQKNADSSLICHKIANIKRDVVPKPDESWEKAGLVPCIRGIISRFSTTESEAKSNQNRVFPFSSAASIPKPSTSPSRSWQSFLPCVLDHKGISRLPSPMKKSPPKSRPPSMSPDDRKCCSHSLTFEVKSLRAQVERLTRKSQQLESELKAKSKQLEEETTRATDNADRCNGLQEKIDKLTAQLKEVTDAASGQSDSKEETHCPSKAQHNSRSRRRCSETKAVRVQLASEQVVQYEAGVLLTIAASPTGLGELRRVRFSRRRFTEAQAEKWWSENEAEVCDRYHVRIAPSS
ncbi:PH, RCC1 and FYVE domains-containing protein 1-like [Andrographis paniculata]|uniref:PH, RCC1 and FYVE domains-containing protein 1-like n=1 Tax=Andrographis paniculata TaxID=175694 RepID=UPI0021E81DAF|nr:PH, RCC1 and FYVE domains-containing protein 1-like [Andrographis paniculata]